MTDAAFIQALNDADRIVAGWPAWKRGIMEASGSPTVKRREVKETEMDTEELRKSAERLNDPRNRYYLDDVAFCEKCLRMMTMMSSTRKMLSDGITVGRAWLAEHPADEHEPITQEWVSSLARPGVQIHFAADRKKPQWVASGLMFEVPLDNRGDYYAIVRALKVFPKTQDGQDAANGD